ncbi:hypothetical protein D3C78_1889760 [compost metagenome]
MSNTIEVVPLALTTTLLTRVTVWVMPFWVMVRVALPGTRLWPSPNWSLTTKLPWPKKVVPKAK